MRHFTVELEELNQKLLQMGGLVESAIHRSVRALLEQDRELAEEVIRDEPNSELLEIMQRDPSVVTTAIDLIFVARNLERIGDHATNIAEDVVFLVKGIDVRHHAQQSEPVYLGTDVYCITSLQG